MEKKQAFTVNAKLKRNAERQAWLSKGLTVPIAIGIAMFLLGAVTYPAAVAASYSMFLDSFKQSFGIALVIPAEMLFFGMIALIVSQTSSPIRSMRRCDEQVCVCDGVMYYTFLPTTAGDPAVQHCCFAAELASCCGTVDASGTLLRVCGDVRMSAGVGSAAGKEGTEAMEAIGTGFEDMEPVAGCGLGEEGVEIPLYFEPDLLEALSAGGMELRCSK